MDTELKPEPKEDMKPSEVLKGGYQLAMKRFNAGFQDKNKIEVVYIVYLCLLNIVFIYCLTMILLGRSSAFVVIGLILSGIEVFRTARKYMVLRKIK